jgi:hypothetical protein
MNLLAVFILVDLYVTSPGYDAARIVALQRVSMNRKQERRPGRGELFLSQLNTRTLRPSGRMGALRSKTLGGSVMLPLGQNGMTTDHGTFGGVCSNAQGINDEGEIVGTASDTVAVHAVLWTPDGSVTRLTAVSEYRGRAYGINKKGEVVGVTGTTTDSDVLPGIWFPVPDGH